MCSKITTRESTIEAPITFRKINYLCNYHTNSDIDMNDAYLLDEEDDDELEYAKELTIDQLLELEGNNKIKIILNNNIRRNLL